ncbi:hypothetical protein [Ktedonobacter sp. SOSP1-85]|nr:hypothetical protein [Ktedonobacter sp. SOSP1-85]
MKRKIGGRRGTWRTTYGRQVPRRANRTLDNRKAKTISLPITHQER